MRSDKSNDIKSKEKCLLRKKNCTYIYYITSKKKCLLRKKIVLTFIIIIILIIDSVLVFIISGEKFAFDTRRLYIVGLLKRFILVLRSP